MKTTFMTKYVWVLLLTAGLSSCAKFLDLEPPTLIPNETAITTTKDLDIVLNGMYDGLQSGNVLGGNAIGYMDLLADDASVQENRLNPFGTQEIYNGTTSVQIGALRDMWRDSYSVINRANNIIAAVDGGKITDQGFESRKSYYKGQALFVRAICHFQLLQLWALPYDVNNIGNNNHAGVVLRTEPTLTGPNGLAKPRATVEECYTQIVKDLEEAVGLLSAAGQITSGTQISAMAAKAFLARVCFYKGDYAKAESNADAVINSNLFGLSDSSNLANAYQVSGSNQVLTNGKSETIFQLVNIPTDASNAAQGYYNQQSGALMTISTSFVDQYEPDTVYDVRRKKLYFNAFVFFYSLKYRSAAGAVTSPNIQVLRLPEMYLISAEASARAANAVSQKSLDRLNTILSRVKFPHIAFSSTNTTEFLEKVTLERRLELCFEGDRYMNLRRLKLPLRKGLAIEYGKFLFKIPQEEIAGYPDIVQNP
jgi:starch-binding outer membrane protein, SusD/RagB family